METQEFDPFEHMIDRKPTPEEVARFQEITQRWEEQGLVRRVPHGSLRPLSTLSTEEIAELQSQPSKELWDDLAIATLGE